LKLSNFVFNEIWENFPDKGAHSKTLVIDKKIVLQNKEKTTAQTLNIWAVLF